VAPSGRGFVQDRLHDAVLTRMIGNDGQYPTRGQGLERRVEPICQFIFFAVHRDAKGLKNSRRDVTTTTGRHGDRAFERFAQFIGRLRLSFEDGLGDRTGEATLPVFTKETYELMLVNVAEELRRRLAPGRVHAHVQRSVSAE